MHAGGQETVGQLLAEQVEKADVVLVNKTDLATEDELTTTEEVVLSLNPNARIIRSLFSQVSPLEILPEIPRKLKYPDCGQGLNYRWVQNEDQLQIRVKVAPGTTSKEVRFNLGRNWVEVWVADETVPRLQGKLFGGLRGLEEWLWELNGVGEERHVSIFLEKLEPAMWEDIWEKPKAGMAPFQHEPSEPSEPSECDAKSMFHGIRPPRPKRSVSLSRPDTSARKRLGIHTFVYERRRPFNSKRLQQLIDAWPLPVNMKTTFKLEDLGADVQQTDLKTVLLPVLRSKGFCWVDSDPLKVQEWSHAGRTFTLQSQDWWWGVLREDQLQFQVSYPGAKAIYEKAQQKWKAEWGDRRQELVFIGGADMVEEQISMLLDSCLLTEAEFEEFRQSTAGVYPDDSFFGIDGLIRRLGEDPEEFRRRGKVPPGTFQDTPMQS